MLKKLRVVTAIVSFSLLSLLFLDFTGALHQWMGWLAKIQLIPAILASNLIIVFTLTLLTLVFGRLYCSVLCPLGILQDIISWLAGKRKKNRFSYSPAKNRLRYVFFALFVFALASGISAVVAVIEPYSAFGRIVSNLLSPVYLGANNALAYFAARADSYSFYSSDIWFKSIVAFVTALITLAVVGVLAWRSGRSYCNTICPVGTFLGFVSRFSVLKPVLNDSECTGCNLCTRNCKSSCIDVKNHSIDYSRCVSCFDCVEKCNRNAIRYTLSTGYRTVRETEVTQAPAEDKTNSRRAFLSTSALFAVAGIVSAQTRIAEGGLAVIEEKKIPERTTPITPPGSVGFNDFSRHCTACGLCISACPNQVLRPSQSLLTLLQPRMSYERGYCRPECTRCSEVCPTSAINKISKAEKSAIQIGYAVWIRDNCVVITDGVNCDNCARHCPSGAIEMIAYDPGKTDSLLIPAVNTERCIGCGACENLCPSRPLSAIYVEGTEMHRIV